MSYIIKSTNPFVSIKLTQTGREQLALGKLNFSYWAVGDSEINYAREAVVDANPTDATLSATSIVLRPVDRQPDIKSFVSPSGTADPLQTVDSSVLSVVKAVVNNQATERGFFSNSSGVYTTLTASTYIKDSTTISTAVLSGGSTLAITTTNIAVGDFILIKTTNATLGTTTVTENAKARPMLWFRVTTVGASSVTLDRNLPNIGGSATASAIVYPGGEIYDSLLGSGATSAYWDSGTLSFDSAQSVTCDDVPVWNMNNVWCESLAGITGLSTTNLYEDYTKFGSYTYLGQKYPYYEYNCVTTATTDTVSSNCNDVGVGSVDDVSKSISILHYTNNTISNLYGEFIYTDTPNGKNLKIYMPDMMYHRRSGTTATLQTQGMGFVASGNTYVLPNTDLEYMNLYEDKTYLASTASPLIVGRMFPQLKTVVIHDDEIVAAMSYKSNRNWTLPELSATLNAPTGGTSTGVLAVGETMFLTYVLETTSGITTSLPCQKYVRITNNTSSAKDIAFKINTTDVLPYMRKTESGWDGYGFYAHKFKLLYQVVSSITDRPDPGSWKQYDFTSTLITGSAGALINPLSLENQTPSAIGFILDKLKDSAATTYSLISTLNLPLNTAPTELQFGDERFFYGNLTTYIGATIYKTTFDIKVNASQFNKTSNPTRGTDTTTALPNIKISEVGIYDSDRNLVCIGKVSTPIALSATRTITLELSLDF